MRLEDNLAGSPVLRQTADAAARSGAHCELPADKFIDAATSRAAPPAELADLMPLMS